jgi:two-component system sensor histidine kinase GlrK
MGSADFTHAITVTGPQDLRYVGQRLEWLRSRLSELEEQQTRFLRHVSHELKTPLTAVREGAELLRDGVGGKLSAEQLDIVRIVRDTTLHLQKLIEDLLAYQQTRAMEPAALAPVALADVVGRVLREQRLAALGRMIAVDAKIAPATVVGDAERLRTIVDNLLSNALKYSPRNAKVEINVGVEDRFAVVDVIDEGRGVADADRSRIFESFYQGPPPVDGRIKGSGLGLAIAREYAVAHGGRVEVRARADGRSGAWFRLALPLADARPAPAKVAPQLATAGHPQ